MKRFRVFRNRKLCELIVDRGGFVQYVFFPLTKPFRKTKNTIFSKENLSDEYLNLIILFDCIERYCFYMEQKR